MKAHAIEHPRKASCGFHLWLGMAVVTASHMCIPSVSAMDLFNIEKLKHPHARGISVADAVTASIWSTARNRPYAEIAAAQTEYLYRNGSELIPPVLCKGDDFTSSDHISCAAIVPVFDSCTSDDCVTFEASSPIMNSEPLRKAMMEAIELPCRVLSHVVAADHYRQKRRPHLYGMHYPIQRSISFLDCRHGKPVTGTVIRVEGRLVFVKIN